MSNNSESPIIYSNSVEAWGVNATERIQKGLSKPSLPPIDEDIVINYLFKGESETQTGYRYGDSQWETDSGDSFTNEDVIEWWPIPKAGTGNKV